MELTGGATTSATQGAGRAVNEPTRGRGEAGARLRAWAYAVTGLWPGLLGQAGIRELDRAPREKDRVNWAGSAHAGK